MLRGLAGRVRIFLAMGYTDLRKGIDGLAALVSSEFDLDPFDASAFVFCGRRCDRVKVLLWTREGFELGYKRLEKGAFRWPRSSQEVQELTPEQYERLLDGFEVIEKSSIEQVERLDMF